MLGKLIGQVGPLTEAQELETQQKETSLDGEYEQQEEQLKIFLKIQLKQVLSQEMV